MVNQPWRPYAPEYGPLFINKDYRPPGLDAYATKAPGFEVTLDGVKWKKSKTGQWWPRYTGRGGSHHFEFRRFKFCNIHFVGKLWMRNPPCAQSMLKTTLVSSKTDITISSFGGLSFAIFFILLESSGCEIRHLCKQC